MSKRDKDKALARGEQPPEIEVNDFRLAGFLPEALTNFIALLGWNPGDARELFSLNELTEAFTLERIGKTNARFDRVKLLSFNTDWACRLSEDRLLGAFKDYLAVSDSSPPSRGQAQNPTCREPARTEGNDTHRGAGQSHPGEITPRVFQPTGIPPTDDDLGWILKVCLGFRTFRQVEEKVRFLFTPDDAIQYDPKAVKKVLAKNDGAGYAMLEHLIPKLEALSDWSPQELEQFLESVCKEKGTKLGHVAQPIRVAITGATVSPSIHESLAKLGKVRTITRVRCCLSIHG